MYLKNTILNKNNIDVLHDGADKVRDLTKKLALKEKENLKVGYVGHLYKGKGIEIESIADKVKHDVEFHIVGGIEEDLNIWKQKIQNNTVYFYGHVPHKELVST